MTHTDERRAAARRPESTYSASYPRFAVMVGVSTLIMYVIMSTSTAFTWADAAWSAPHVYMAFVMGATMTVVMLLFMRDMYRSTRLNTTVIAGCLATAVVATVLLH